MEKKNEVELTASEISSLWTGYINNMMSQCVMKYFIKTVEDEEIKPVLEYALELAILYNDETKKIFETEDFPIPHGFTENDVNLDADRLFTDLFMINFVKSMAKVGLSTYALARALSTRKDVRSLFKTCVETTMELDDRALDVMLNKGILIRPPYLPVPDRVRFIEKKNFLNGFIGERRPLVVQEITNLFTNLDTNLLGESLMTAFGQVADSQSIRDFMWRGRKIAKKHATAFASKLTEGNLPAPSLWDTSVTKSKEAPFSDKLMMFMTTFLNAAGIANYGLAASASMRHDISFMYVRLTSEVALFTEDAADIMLERGWMEEPPQSPDRKSLNKG
jgi:hypothetical protein